MTGTRLALLALAATLSGPAHAPSPPEQPAAGPGGRDYPHASVTASRLGAGADEVHVFEPADPRPDRAPAVVFCHGWGGTDPNIYGAWITHIVRRGFIVIYPRYQADLRTSPRDFTAHALTATRHALNELAAPGHVAPDERGLAFVGHSMGGLVAANLAAHAARGQLPPPLVLMAVEPARSWPEASPIAFPLEDLSGLPPSLLLLTVVGEEDEIAREVDARKVYTSASGIARANKAYVRMLSDAHGAPGLRADHRAPTAPALLVETGEPPAPVGGDRGRTLARAGNDRGPMVTDALDYYGTWKLLDGLVDAAYRGVHREYALGGTAQQRHMGQWSDGVPVRELVVEAPWR